MLTIKRYPATIFPEFGKVVCVESRPYLVDGLSAYEAPQTAIVIVESLLTVAHYRYAIIEPFLKL